MEGMGEDFVPPNCDLRLVRRGLPDHRCRSFGVARELLGKEGVLAGSSTGSLIAAVLKWCRKQRTPKSGS